MEDKFIMVIRYQKKLARRTLRDVEERLEYTAENHTNVDLSPMWMVIQVLKERIETLEKSIRLYRKHILAAGIKNDEKEQKNE